MKYYIKLENGYITDCIKTPYEGYIEIETDFNIGVGFTKYIDGKFTIDENRKNNIQKDFTQEEMQKIASGYSYNIETGEFEESEASIEYEKQILENKKTSLLKEIGQLKQIKDGMELVGDDITEITVKINDLISEYKSL